MRWNTGPSPLSSPRGRGRRNGETDEEKTLKRIDINTRNFGELPATIERQHNQFLQENRSQFDSLLSTLSSTVRSRQYIAPSERVKVSLPREYHGFVGRKELLILLQETFLRSNWDPSDSTSV